MKGCRRVLTWIAYGIGGLVGLVIILVILAAIIAPEESSSEQRVRTLVASPVEQQMQELIEAEPAPKPTATLTSTPVPEPILIVGTGDSIQDINKWSGPAIVHIVGNASLRHFAVIPYDPDGNRDSSLVNTTEKYDGRNLIDFKYNQHTNRLEILSEGDWTIEILPLSSARILQVPGTIEGTGDDVLLLMGGTPDIADIAGNPNARHFAVLPYGNGRRFGSMVNTTDPYRGQTLIGRETQVLQVIAVGQWSISATAVP